MDAFVIRSSKSTSQQQPSRGDSSSSRKAEDESRSRTASLLAYNDPKKYLLKSEASRPKGSLNLIPKARGQQRISDLKGVVSLDRFEDVVSQLTDETVSDTTKVRLLKSLREKQPATQVIQSTGIGKIVRQLSRSEEGEGVICEEVRREALKVYKDWKGLVESRVQKKIEAKHIEVACDEDTIKARQTTVSLFRQAVIKAKQNSSGQSNASLTDKDKLLTTQIEKCLFKCSGNLLNKAYRRAGRKIVFELTYQQQRQDSNSMPLNFDDIEALVTKHVKK